MKEETLQMPEITMLMTLAVLVRAQNKSNIECLSSNERNRLLPKVRQHDKRKPIGEQIFFIFRILEIKTMILSWKDEIKEQQKNAKLVF